MVQPLVEAIRGAPGERIIAYEGEKLRKLGEHLATMDSPSEVSIFTGPEGGYSDDEYDAALAADAVPVGLGETTLRAETAAIVALAIARDRLAAGQQGLRD